MGDHLKTDESTHEDAEQDGGIHRDDRFLHSIFRRFLFPTMLSVLGGTINTMVDSAIVGNLMGETALAVINLCAPVFLLFYTAGNLIGSGGGFLAASFAGKNDEEESRRCYTLAVMLELGSGLLLMGLGVIFLHPIVRVLGADAEMYEMTLAYARISFWSAPLKCLIYVPYNFLRLDGKPGVVSISLVAMTASNAVLDVLLIRAGMGMAGASLASAIGSAIGVAIGFAYLRGGNFRLVPLHRVRGILGKMLFLGTPAALNNLLNMARLMIMNRLIMELGGSSWVAVFTAACGMCDFSLCIVSGVPQTAAPLAGVYCAERNNVALRQLMKMQLIYGGGLIAGFSILMALFPAPVCAFFGLELTQQAAIALRMLALSLPFALVCSCLIFFYNVSGRVRLSNIITLCRVFVFAVGSAFAFGRIGMPVWLFFPASEVLTLLFLSPGIEYYRKKADLSPVLLLDETLEREGKVIDFSVANSLTDVTQASERISDFCENNELASKQSMAVSLSIEEMLVLVLEHCFHPGQDVTADVRVFAIQDEIGVRIRNAGAPFNPVAYYEEHQDEDEMGETLGIRMILKMAKDVKYQHTFGVNTLTILIISGK